MELPVGPRRDNLPSLLSAFIGREGEIAEVRQQLAAHRLLTLTGPGGCGKTRLAIQAAGELLEAFEDGVWLTEFASLADAVLVPQAVASVLGVHEQPGRAPIDALADHLLPRTTLLVLDNCEHLVAACAQFAEALLQACPDLRMLATSREPLGVPGEAVWSVPPLSLPDPQPWRDPASGPGALSAYERSEAVRLFVARAAAALPAFTLTAQNGAWVAEVCRRLDGMPLAIELAAARVRTLKIAEIAARLDDRFHLLADGSRTALPRHQTLRAAIDWSYDLLSEKERALLRRLSVFAGGWSLAAAEAVGQDGISSYEILDLLAHLVDKSMVVVDKQGSETRYRLLETIREYASERLLESGEQASICNRHLGYFLQLAEAAGPQLGGSDQAAWLNQLELEHDNLRAALDWSRTAEDEAEVGLRLAGALGSFWEAHGYYSEGREQLSAALSRQGASERTAARAKALYEAGHLAYMQSDYPAVRSLLDESMSIYRELGPAGRLGLAHALITLGDMETEVGEYDWAASLMKEALGIMREMKNVGGIARALWQLGACVVRPGDYEQAVKYFAEALSLYRQNGDKWSMSIVISGLGEVAVRQGDYRRATVLLEESLTLRREIGNRWGIAVSLGSLGWVALLRGNLQQAVRLLGESLTLRREIGDRGGIAWCLEKLAEVALTGRQGESPPRPRYEALRRAALLFGAAASLRSPIGSVIDLVDQPAYERNLAALRAALGEAALTAAWAEGGAMALEQAVEYALAEPETPAASLSPAQTAKEKYGGLTAREREVAALIAQGKSNREIAQVMVVGVRTVETYVTRILNKLGFDSRVQIATWAKDKGLA